MHALAHDPETAALRGLVGVLNAKLELHQRLELLTYEARVDGQLAAAALAEDLAADEGAHVDRLMAAIAEHVTGDTTAPPAPAPRPALRAV